MKPMIQFDKFAASYVARLPSFLKPIAIWMGRCTTPLLWASYTAALSYTVLTPGEISYSSLLVIILLPLASLLKLFIRRQRPITIYTQSMKIRSYSFPSSHAYAAVLGAGHIAITAPLGAVIGLMALFIATIGVSRVYVGAHYPTDVIGGWLLGLLILTFIY